MPKVTNSKANDFFAFTLKPILEWKETSPEDFETDSVQSVSLDASEDFFDNFDPEVERQIVRNHLKYLDQLVTEIARTTPIILEAFDRRANLEKQKQAKAPPPREKQLKDLLRISGSSRCNKDAKNPPACGRTRATRQKGSYRQPFLTPGF